MSSKSLLKILLTVLAASLMLALAPSTNPVLTFNIAHPYDDSVLLMFSAQMRLGGEVESALLPKGHLMSLSQQAGLGNELDILIQLYADQIAKLKAGSNYDPDLEAKLINQLEAKVQALQKKAQALTAKRSRGRGGLFGFIRHGFKKLGRATGWLLGKTMEGAGKVAEFAIEKVAPKVLKEAVLSGAPLNANLVKQVTRQLLKRRVHTLFEKEVEKLAERINQRQEAAYADGQATDDPHVWETNEAEFGLDAALMDQEEMDATREAREKTPQADSGSSSGGDSGSGTAVYDFTNDDAYKFFGIILWAHPSQPDRGYCFGMGLNTNSGAVHLEIDWDALTASGWVDYSGTTIDDFENATGNARITFSDLPAVPPPDGSGIMFRFVGEGSGTFSIESTVLCQRPDEFSNIEQFYFTRQESGTISMPRMTIDFYRPGAMDAENQPVTLSFIGYSWKSGGVESSGAADLSFGIYTSQPLDVPEP